jgi:predicted CopG family antitoxin
MATKCITITVDAYERLARLKGPKDSFSDVITNLTAKYSFLDLVGILSPQGADELESNIKDLRKRMNQEMEARARRFGFT